MKLTPNEVIRLGIEQGHSADVIVASMEAAGWNVVERKPTCVCPACLKTDAAEFVASPTDFEGYAEIGRPYSVMRCGACRSLFLDPMPSAAEAARFYPPDYMTKADKGGLFRSMTDWWERRSARLFAGRFGNDSSVLDYGCGQGDFVFRLRSIGMSVCGYDPMPKEVTGFYHSLDALDGQRFDVIRMNNVIEHLTDFDATMIKLRSLLAPGGVVFGATANGAHFAASLFGRYWGFLHYPYHTLIFSPDGLRAAARRWGYADVEIRSMPEPSSWAFTAEHYLKAMIGSTRRGHLPVYPLLVIASAAPLAIDLAKPGLTTAIEFVLRR